MKCDDARRIILLEVLQAIDDVHVTHIPNVDGLSNKPYVIQPDKSGTCL